MAQKQRVLILFGGKSAEHEISLISAMNIIHAIDRDRYELLLIGVDKEGRWWLQDENQFMALESDPKTIAIPAKSEQVAVITGTPGPHLLLLATGEYLPEPDVVFAILHGPNGEDGTMQGLLRHLNLPFVGSDVTGSAVAMDKDVAKRLLTEAGIPNSPFLVFRQAQREEIKFEAVAERLKLPLFVKPANMGSSVGISKVTKEAEFGPAIDEAFRYDAKIVIEEGIVGREVEVAILGNFRAKASAIGEIVPVNGFYDYEAKYINAEGAKLLLPAPNIDAETAMRLQNMAILAYQVLECEGLSRVDFFLCADGELYVNEINTLPGFTSISMYPSLWELSGIAYADLITELLDLAISRHEDANDRLNNSY